MVAAAAAALAAPGASAAKGAPAGAIRGTVLVDTGGVAAGVYLTGGPEVDEKDQRYRPQQYLMRQHNLIFEPGWIIIRVGDSVRFPNDDGATDHSVFSPHEKYGFDLHMSNGGPGKKREFTHAGEYDIRCSIHQQMKATILVVKSLYVTQSNAKGEFVLEGVPPGEYTLHAWLPDRVEVEQPVVVVAGKSTDGATLVFKRPRKPREYPTADKRSYGDRY